MAVDWLLARGVVFILGFLGRFVVFVFFLIYLCLFSLNVYNYFFGFSVVNVV